MKPKRGESEKRGELSTLGLFLLLDRFDLSFEKLWKPETGRLELNDLNSLTQPGLSLQEFFHFISPRLLPTIHKGRRETLFILKGLDPTGEHHFLHQTKPLSTYGTALQLYLVASSDADLTWVSFFSSFLLCARKA